MVIEKQKENMSLAARLKSGIGGLAVIFTAAMTAITTLIVCKSAFSEYLFLLTLIGILVAGAGASIHMFCYGVVRRQLKLASKTEQHSIELTKERRALSVMTEKIEKELDRLLLLKNHEDEEPDSEK